MNFHYVDILESELYEDRYYVGLTGDLNQRLKKHNSGEVSHTRKHLPWRIKNAIARSNREKAAEFEKYFRSHSGRGWSKKHL